MSTRRAIPSPVVVAFVSAIGAACVHGQLGEPQPAPEAVEHAPVVEKGTPPAAPVEHALRLCALSPGEPAGLRTLDAVTVEGRPDTLAVIDGERVPLSQAVAGARVASQAQWFVQRRSLEIGTAGRLQRFRIYDVPREIEASQLTYLGTVDSLPVYVAAEDAAPVRSELAKRLAAQRDLTKLLSESPALRARLRAIDVLYVPLHATGCVFQPMLRAGVS